MNIKILLLLSIIVFCLIFGGVKRETLKENNKILIIICTHDINYHRDINAIKSLKKYIIDDPKLQNYEKDIAFICSNKDDLDKFDDIINIKYKIEDNSKQLSKVCNFMKKIPDNYKWYIKSRPDFELYDYIDFLKIDENKINARTRTYEGPPINIKYGFSDPYKDKLKSDNLKIVMDDMIYVYSTKIKHKFKDIISKLSNESRQDEWYHTDKLNIPINIISINGNNLKNNYRSNNLII